MNMKRIQDALYPGYVIVKADTGSQVHPESALPSIPAAARASASDALDWMACEKISEVPAVDEALRTFTEDATADNATGIIVAVAAALAQKGAAQAAHAGVERRRNLATAKLPLDVECALEHVAIVMDQAHQRLTDVLRKHLPGGNGDGR